jgi:hypothetical protein
MLDLMRTLSRFTLVASPRITDADVPWRRAYTFAVLKLPQLVSLIREANGAARRVAEKVGMRLETTLVRYGGRYRLYAWSHEQATSLTEKPPANHDY